MGDSRRAVPDFVVIGAMKAGTTSLYRYLQRHPELSLATPKEPNFFIEERTESQLDRYHACFDERKRLWGDVSPNYAKRHLFDGVPERIRRYAPQTRVIISVRDPVDRALSHYLHNRARGRETRSAEAALAAPHNNYLLTSSYWHQLEPYVKTFGRERILVVEAEDLLSDANQVLGEVCSFLGVAPFRVPASQLRRYNASVTSGRARVLFARLRTILGKLRLLNEDVPQPAPRPLLGESVQSQIRQYLEEDAQAFRRFSSLPLARWQV